MIMIKSLYWNNNKDILKNNNLLMKSYIIYAQNNLVSCYFTKGSFDKTNFLQTNENYNKKTDTTNIPGFNEHQNFIGILYHSSVQSDKRVHIRIIILIFHFLKNHLSIFSVLNFLYLKYYKKLIKILNFVG